MQPPYGTCGRASRSDFLGRFLVCPAQPLRSPRDAVRNTWFSATIPHSPRNSRKVFDDRNRIRVHAGSTTSLELGSASHLNTHAAKGRPTDATHLETVHPGTGQQLSKPLHRCFKIATSQTTEANRLISTPHCDGPHRLHIRERCD